MQNSEIAGQRHLNDRARRSFETQKKRNVALAEHRAFVKKMDTRLKAEAAQWHQARAINGLGVDSEEIRMDSVDRTPDV